MITKIGVIGLGKVGSLVGTLLQPLFEVEGMDRAVPYEKLSFDVKTGDVSNMKSLKAFLKGKDAVVSCLPYQFNLKVAHAAFESGIHYFDLTEDVPTMEAIQGMAAKSKSILAPQCGLAPGFIGIVGAGLYKQFTKIRSVKLRVGALPLQPVGKLGYSFTWSAEGVINEYLNDAEVIHNGQRKKVPSLEDIEVIHINGREYEAFYTSGGLGTMCATLEGKVDTLNYKTIRYPGHCDLMKFYLYELLMKNNRQQAQDILTNAYPVVQEDVVLVYASVDGWKKGKLVREEFNEAYVPIEINGKQWRAISWTTAASVASVVELAAQGKLGAKGFLKQEDIPLDLFLSTANGSLYKDYSIGK